MSEKKVLFPMFWCQFTCKYITDERFTTYCIITREHEGFHMIQFQPLDQCRDTFVTKSPEPSLMWSESCNQHLQHAKLNSINYTEMKVLPTLTGMGFSEDSCLSRICLRTPTSSSSTLCWRPTDVSMNLASQLLANSLPSSPPTWRDLSRSTLLPT